MAEHERVTNPESVEQARHVSGKERHRPAAATSRSTPFARL
jgi:hypothetical protein